MSDSKKRLVQGPINTVNTLRDSLGLFLMVTRWLWWFQTLCLLSWQKKWERASALHLLYLLQQEMGKKKINKQNQPSQTPCNKIQFGSFGLKWFINSPTHPFSSEAVWGRGDLSSLPWSSLVPSPVHIDAHRKSKFCC